MASNQIMNANTRPRKLKQNIGVCNKSFASDYVIASNL